MCVCVCVCGGGGRGVTKGGVSCVSLSLTYLHRGIVPVLLPVLVPCPVAFFLDEAKRVRGPRAHFTSAAGVQRFQLALSLQVRRRCAT